MSDALISPAVGGGMWAATAGAIAYCSASVRKNADDRQIPLMGVLGAFLFAAQMINFTIPLTGSSGHLGGGLLLAIFLGPQAAFLTIASVLFVQALFFADGGLLALGCNIFNMGFFPAFIAYPLIYKQMLRNRPSSRWITAATVVSAVIGLQLGAFAVVLETYASSMTALPFAGFVMLMQPIHLAIGLVEGFATAAIVSFVYKTRRESLPRTADLPAAMSAASSKVLVLFMVMAIMLGGIVSWYASEAPDGLEWAISKLTGKPEPVAPQQDVHRKIEELQRTTAFLPGYTFKTRSQSESTKKIGTSLSGVVGGLLTLLLLLLLSLFFKKRGRTDK